jgi:hypothetical protein
LRLLQPARSAGNGMASLSYRQQFVQSPAAVVARHTHALAVPAAAEDFFASSAVTFSGMGLADELCSALKHAGYPQPAHAQVRCNGAAPASIGMHSWLLCSPFTCVLFMMH